LYQRVHSRHVPICPFWHFRCNRLATKCTENIESNTSWCKQSKASIRTARRICPVGSTIRYHSNCWASCCIMYHTSCCLFVCRVACSQVSSGHTSAGRLWTDRQLHYWWCASVTDLPRHVPRSHFLFLQDSRLSAITPSSTHVHRHRLVLRRTTVSHSVTMRHRWKKPFFTFFILK